MHRVQLQLISVNLIQTRILVDHDFGYIGAKQGGVVKIASRKIRPFKGGLYQICISERAPLQIAFVKYCAASTHKIEIAIDQFGTGKVGFSQITTSEYRFIHVDIHKIAIQNIAFQETT